MEVIEHRLSLKQIPGYYSQKLGNIPYGFEMTLRTASPEVKQKILEPLRKAGIL